MEDRKEEEKDYKSKNVDPIIEAMIKKIIQ